MAAPKLTPELREEQRKKLLANFESLLKDFAQLKTQLENSKLEQSSKDEKIQRIDDFVSRLDSLKKAVESFNAQDSEDNVTPLLNETQQTQITELVNQIQDFVVALGDAFSHIQGPELESFNKTLTSIKDVSTQLKEGFGGTPDVGETKPKETTLDKIVEKLRQLQKESIVEEIKIHSKVIREADRIVDQIDKGIKIVDTFLSAQQNRFNKFLDKTALDVTAKLDKVMQELSIPDISSGLDLAGFAFKGLGALFASDALVVMQGHGKGAGGLAETLRRGFNSKEFEDAQRESAKVVMEGKRLKYIQIGNVRFSFEKVFFKDIFGKPFKNVPPDYLWVQRIRGFGETTAKKVFARTADQIRALTDRLAPPIVKPFEEIEGRPRTYPELYDDTKRGDKNPVDFFKDFFIRIMKRKQPVVFFVVVWPDIKDIERTVRSMFRIKKRETLTPEQRNEKIQDAIKTAEDLFFWMSNASESYLTSLKEIRNKIVDATLLDKLVNPNPELADARTFDEVKEDINTAIALIGNESTGNTLLSEINFFKNSLESTRGILEFAKQDKISKNFDLTSMDRSKEVMSNALASAGRILERLKNVFFLLSNVTFEFVGGERRTFKELTQKEMNTITNSHSTIAGGLEKYFGELVTTLRLLVEKKSEEGK